MCSSTCTEDRQPGMAGNAGTVCGANGARQRSKPQLSEALRDFDKTLYKNYYFWSVLVSKLNPLSVYRLSSIAFGCPRKRGERFTFIASFSRLLCAPNDRFEKCLGVLFVSTEKTSDALSATLCTIRVSVTALKSATKITGNDTARMNLPERTCHRPTATPLPATSTHRFV